MKSNPLISFCIPTYRRPKLLEKTIRSVLAQNYQTVEIIISDNDPEGSAENIVKQFKSKKIHYIVQKSNVGMMNNFGKAFDASKGDYIIFLGDDDPIEKNMLTTLLKLKSQFPSAGAYFGAPSLLITDPTVAKLHGLKIGRTGMRKHTRKKGAVIKYTPSDFLKAFLTYDIFDYFFWSCGMVRRDIVKKVDKAHPLNGSDLLTDYAYILRVGTTTEVVTINNEIGTQQIHSGNYGRKNEELLTLKPAIRGLYNEMLKLSIQYNCQKDLEKFIGNWVLTHILSLLRFRRITNSSNSKLFFLNLYGNLASDFPFLKKNLLSFYIRVLFPTQSELYHKNKWVFEILTFKKGLTKILHNLNFGN